MSEEIYLTESEEKELAIRIQNGDIEARNELVSRNTDLVLKVANSYRVHVKDENVIEDLISAGNVGLIKAADTFDYTRGFRFSTYAVTKIKYSILDYLSLKENLISLDEEIDDEGNTLKTFWGDENAVNPQAVYLTGDLYNALQSLSGQKRDVIMLRYGIGGSASGYKVSEVAKELNLSDSQVRRLEANALRELRQILGDDYIDDLFDL